MRRWEHHDHDIGGDYLTEDATPDKPYAASATAPTDSATPSALFTSKPLTLYCCRPWTQAGPAGP